MKPRVHRLGSDKNGISGSASFPERKEILISGSCLAKTSAGLRPSEARGARWEHYDGRTLSVKQSVWRKHTTDPKTASSAKPVLVIEPLRELRTKLQQAEGNPVSGPILRGVKLKDSKPRPLDVNMLAKRGEAKRVIRPALRSPKTYRDLEAKPLEWQAFYSLRRGIATQLTAITRDAMASQGAVAVGIPAAFQREYNSSALRKDVPEVTANGMARIEQLFSKLAEKAIQ